MDNYKALKLIITILFCLSITICKATNYHPTPSEGGGFYSTTPPYDTIYLNNSYSWETLQINNWHGTSWAHPIVILPYGGDVVIGNNSTITTGTYGLIWTNCWYIKMEGINNWGSATGFFVQAAPNNIATLSGFGIWLSYYCKCIRFDSVTVRNVNIGFHDGVDADCDPLANYPNWIYDSIYFHKGVIVRTWNQGVYCGNTNPDNYPVPAAAHPGFFPRAVSCNNIVTPITATFSASANTIVIPGNYADSFSTIYYFGVLGSASNNSVYYYNTSNATFDGTNTTIHCLNDAAGIANETHSITIVRVIYPSAARDGFHSFMYNRIDSNGRANLQLSSASKDISEIANNTLGHSGLNGDAGQGPGIYLGGYTQAYVHDNTVVKNLEQNINSLGASGTQLKIGTNTIDSANKQDPFTFPSTWPLGFVYNYDTMHTTPNLITLYMYSIYVDTRLEAHPDSSSFKIYNNQIGKATISGIGIGDEQNMMKKAPNSNYICSNTGFNGTATPPPITEVNGAVVPYNTDCTLPASTDLKGRRFNNYRIIRN